MRRARSIARDTATVRSSPERGLARMIVVVSEALRFDSVAAGVNAILAMDGSFRPNADTLRAWDGHTLGMGRVSPWLSRAQEPSDSGGGTSLQ